MPGSTTYSLALYYMMNTPVEDSPLLQNFINGDDAYRNSRFKLIPYISKVGACSILQLRLRIFQYSCMEVNPLVGLKRNSKTNDQAYVYLYLRRRGETFIFLFGAFKELRSYNKITFSKFSVRTFCRKVNFSHFG